MLPTYMYLRLLYSSTTKIYFTLPYLETLKLKYTKPVLQLWAPKRQVEWPHLVLSRTVCREIKEAETRGSMLEGQGAPLKTS